MNATIRFLYTNGMLNSLLKIVVISCYLALFIYDFGLSDKYLRSDNHYLGVCLEQMGSMWLLFAIFEGYFIVYQSFNWFVLQFRRLITAAVPFYVICKLVVLNLDWYSIDWAVLVILAIQFAYLIIAQALEDY